MALVVTPEGLPLAYEMMPGNTVDNSTLRASWTRSSGCTGRRSGYG